MAKIKYVPLEEFKELDIKKQSYMLARCYLDVCEGSVKQSQKEFVKSLMLLRRFFESKSKTEQSEIFTLYDYLYFLSQKSIHLNIDLSQAFVNAANHKADVRAYKGKVLVDTEQYEDYKEYLRKAGIEL